MATAVRNPDGTFTVTLTAAEQDILTRRAAKEGIGPAPALAILITRRLREWLQQYRERVATARQDAYEAALPSARTTADAAIGFTPPEV